MVRTSIDSVEVYIGSQAHYSIEVVAADNSKIQMPQLQPRTYLSPGLEIVEQERADTILRKGHKTIKHTWTITAFDEGVYPVPKQKVLVDSKTYTTEQLALKVITLDVDTLHPEKFFPPKDVQNNPFLLNEWLPMLWIFLFLQLLTLMLYIALRLLQQRRSIVKRLKSNKRLLPHEQAMKAIDALKQEKIMYESDEKTYYTALTDILRRYLEERFEFNAREMTSSEIVATLYAKGEKHMIREMQELFEMADLVKFAKFQAQIDEKDKNLLDAIKYIDETKLIPSKEEKEKEEEIPADQMQSVRERKVLKTICGILVVGLIVLITYFCYYPFTLLL